MHGNVWRCCTLGISRVCPFAICCTWHNSCGFRIETDLFFRLLMSPYFLPIQLYLSNVITVSSLNKTFIYGVNITQSGSVTPWRYQEYLKVYQKIYQKIYQKVPLSEQSKWLPQFGHIMWQVVNLFIVFSHLGHTISLLLLFWLLSTHLLLPLSPYFSQFTFSGSRPHSAQVWNNLVICWVSSAIYFKHRSVTHFTYLVKYLTF